MCLTNFNETHWFRKISIPIPINIVHYLHHIVTLIHKNSNQALIYFIYLEMIIFAVIILNS